MVRSARQRRADTLERLRTDQDVWVATADNRGNPHLIAMSLCWYDDEAVFATEATSRTARNVAAPPSARVRLALASTSDVVIIDAAASLVPTAAADQSLIRAFRERSGWDPTTGWDPSEEADYVYLRCRPRRIQAWRNDEEFPGRTIMRDGIWV